MLCMYEAPGSIPGISRAFLGSDCGGCCATVVLEKRTRLAVLMEKGRSLLKEMKRQAIGRIKIVRLW